MRNLLTKLRYVPKHFAAALAVLVAGAGVTLSLAWGPDRPAFTVENPASYVTFNSITNNPVDGNEFNFVRIKGDGVPLSDNVTAEEGKEYTVRILVHNNAGENLNLESINTLVKAAVPTTTGKEVKITGFVSADNAKPKEVWDEASLKSDRDFNVAYVAGSAKIYNQGYAKGGASLPDSIVTSAGAKVGYKSAADGKIPGCFKYLSYVEFKVKPQFAKEANFEMAKTVSLHGKNEWKENVTAQPGELVDFRIKYKNTGEVAQDNVVVKDKLPAGLSYQNGTTMLYSTLFPSGKKLNDKLTTDGINIGHYAPNSTAYVMFTAKVTVKSPVAEGENCDARTLKNVAQVQTDYGAKDDDATVTVPVECAVPQPVAVCESLKVVKIDRTTYRLDAKASVKNGATISQYTFKVGDQEQVVKTSNTTASSTFKTLNPGNYKASVTVKTSLGDRTGANCEATINVEQPPKEQPKMVKVCDLKDNQVREITEQELADNPDRYTKDLSQCEEKPAPETEDVCELESGDTITINEGEFDSELHSRDMSECDEVVETPREETPKGEETPGVIAATGPGQIIGGLFGSSALGLGFTSYLRSRRALLGAGLS